MKILRIAGLIFFLLSAITFMGYSGYQGNNRDELGPEITFTGDSISVSINASDEEILQDVTAFDNNDGDVGASLLIEKTSNFTGAGKRIITYAAFDASNNVTKRERELVYTDYTPPRFKLTKPLSFNIGEEDELLQNMTVQDSMDGDITDRIKYDTQNYNFGFLEGIYPVEFQATNSMGDTAYLPAQVEIHYPNNQNKGRIPEIQLSEYNIYLKVGEFYNAGVYLKNVIIGREEYSFQEGQTYGNNAKTISKNKVTIDSNVNSKVPGAYCIEYSLTTEDGYTGTAKLLVIVEE